MFHGHMTRLVASIYSIIIDLECILQTTILLFAACSIEGDRFIYGVVPSMSEAMAPNLRRACGCCSMTVLLVLSNHLKRIKYD